MLLCFLPCVFDKECLLFCLQTCLLFLLRFQPCIFNKAGLVFKLQPQILLLRFQPCLFNYTCFIFSMHPCVLLLILLLSLYQFKGEADPLPYLQPCTLMPLYFQPCPLIKSSLLFCLQNSAVNPPPLPQLLDFPLQRDVPLLQPLSVCAPPLSV